MTDFTEPAALAAWCHSPEGWAEWVAAAQAAGVEVPDLGARLTAGMTQITSMENMFKGCATPADIDVTQITSMEGMFKGCATPADNGGSND